VRVCVGKMRGVFVVERLFSNSCDQGGGGGVGGGGGGGVGRRRPDHQTRNSSEDPEPGARSV